MKPLATFTLSLVTLFTLTSCEQQAPETLFQGEYSDEEMDAAMENARAHVDHFIEVIQSDTPPETFAIKAAISDEENTEHFWITDITYADGSFTGELGNDPGLVTNVKFGDEITVKAEEISDWMYMAGEKMHGNYTLRVELPGMDPTEAIRWRQSMAELPE